MMRPVARMIGAVLAVLLMGLLVGCGGTPPEVEGGGQDPECRPQAPPLESPPELPAGFPTPEGVEFTGMREAGPSTIVEGSSEAEMGEVYEAYLAAFPEAGYDVPFEEQEENDAEVNFAGGGTDGQVKLRRCGGHTEITITIRPQT